MVGNALAWSQGIEDSMLKEALATMEVAEFRILFEAQYIPDTIKGPMKDQFRELRLGGMSVQVYAKKFTKYALFVPEYMTIDVVRAGRFRYRLRH